MQPSLASHTDEERVNADTLLWQGRFRMSLLPLLAVLSVVLRWLGVVSVASVFAPTLGVPVVLLLVLAIAATYTALQWYLTSHLHRRGRASLRLVLGVLTVDVVALFSSIALITPPAHYVRALIISIFSVQFAQLSFGWLVTMAHLVTVAAGYTVLLQLATSAGYVGDPLEELWTLAVYGVGLIVYVGIQGHMLGRMRGLVQLFDRAQEGDFSARYDEGSDPMPDPISVIGRAYNRMRIRLEEIVLTDPLSGCFNRRGLSQLTEREVSRAVRGKKSIAVLAVDVDHFKSINDEFGHLTGDEVIREVGALLRETAREVDVVARLGGEEFVIIAPDSTDEGALILAERLLEAFRLRQFASLPSGRKISTSVGAAAAPARDHDIVQTLLARADEALYVAKHNGRDRASLWHAGMRASDGTSFMPKRPSDPTGIGTVR